MLNCHHYNLIYNQKPKNNKKIIVKAPKDAAISNDPQWMLEYLQERSRIVEEWRKKQKKREKRSYKIKPHQSISNEKNESSQSFNEFLQAKPHNKTKCKWNRGREMICNLETVQEGKRLNMDKLDHHGFQVLPSVILDRYQFIESSQQKKNRNQYDSDNIRKEKRKKPIQKLITLWRKRKSRSSI